MLKLFKRSKNNVSIYRCKKCKNGEYRIIDKREIDKGFFHNYKCDRCGYNVLMSTYNKR